jgi:hypothetical protein
MHRIISVYGRKLFSITLLFNALLTITCALGLLWGMYTENWKIYPPYLPDGNLFWLAIIAGVVNIFPAANVGTVHTGRLWFHHYVWGFFVMVISVVWLVLGTSVSLLTAFFVNTSNLAVNVGRFFFLGGLTLVLDDLPDVHAVTYRGVQWLKRRAHNARTALQILQFALGIATFYLFITVAMSITAKPQWITAANFIQMGTLLVTSVTALASVRHKVWHKLKFTEQTFHRHH